MEDERIVSLYWERDESAIQRTEEKYGRYCYAIAYNILHSREDADECVNDTWLRAWTSIPPARPAYLQQFLGGITRHISLDKYRSNQRNAITVAIDELGDVVNDEPSVPTQAEMREMMLAIDRFLWSLPARECNVFIRRYYHFDEIKDIAKRYKLTQSNIKTILSRTRAKLRTYLEKEGYTV